jgi:hypothetical protein
MTKKEVDEVLKWGSSHLFPIQGYPLGVTKFQVFLAIHRILKGKLYWYALRNSYDLSDNLYQYRHDVLLAFSSNEPQREFLMSKKERDFWQSLPERITIYRGMTLEEQKQKSFGISWTLKKEIAEFFANDYQRNYSTRHKKKVVHQIEINKNEVIAFFNERTEFEIIYLGKITKKRTDIPKDLMGESKKRVGNW